MNPYAAHATRIAALCDWILEANTRQAVVSRYHSALESAAETSRDIARLRIARRLALTIVANRSIRVAGSPERN
jgi:hypothetical protein